MVLLCGRYEGFDDRVRKILEPDEISIGDVVLGGGEVAAMVVIDAVARLIPGVLGDEESNRQDSFAGDEPLLEFEQYTRPREYRGHEVPDVLSKRKSRRNCRVAAAAQPTKDSRAACRSALRRSAPDGLTF